MATPPTTTPAPTPTHRPIPEGRTDGPSFEAKVEAFQRIERIMRKRAAEKKQEGAA